MPAIIYHLKCIYADAVPGNSFDNPIYGEGKGAEQGPAKDSLSPSPSANFDNPLYGFAEQQHLRATQLQPHKKPIQSHGSDSYSQLYDNEIPQSKQQLQQNKGVNFYSKEESHFPNSAPGVDFQDVLYEPTSTAAL